MVISNNLILINEIFQSIQGEGPRLGVSTLFVRVYGCNLRCRFNDVACDTPFAVKGNHFTRYTVNDLYLEIVSHLSNSPLPLITFTGGEPLLYQNEIYEVIKKIRKINPIIKIEFETNGTIKLNKNFRRYIQRNGNIFFNISCKLKNSNQEKGYDNRRINLKALRSYPKECSIFKIVCTTVDDILEFEYEVGKYFLEHTRYVMPEGMTRTDVNKNGRKIVKDILNTYPGHYIFSPRIHINLWNTKKGV